MPPKQRVGRLKHRRRPPRYDSVGEEDKRQGQDQSLDSWEFDTLERVVK